MISFAVFIALTGALCLVVGASRHGWRLVALSLLLVAVLPFFEAHGRVLLCALSPVLDTILVGTLVLVVISVFQRRTPRDPSDKRRVERD